MSYTYTPYAIHMYFIHHYASVLCTAHMNTICMSYKVCHTFYNVHCISMLYILRCISYVICRMSYIVHRAMYIICCTPYIVHCSHVHHMHMCRTLTSVMDDVFSGYYVLNLVVVDKRAELKWRSHWF
jgi:hypothetical protein